MKTWIRNGKVVTENGSQYVDLLVENGIITVMDNNIAVSHADKILDASGCLVLPGGVDVHTHLDWNFADKKTADDFSTGSKAAAAGGITSIINFTNRGKGQTLLEDLLEWKERAKPCNIDYGFHVIINDYNEQMLLDLPHLIAEGATSIKLFMAYKDVFMVDDGAMFDIMQQAGKLGFMTCVHAENGDIIDRLIRDHLAAGHVDTVYHSLSRPPELEAEAAHRAIAIAELANAPLYIVHVSSSAAMEEVKLARSAGKRVFGETCPQYLTLDITDLMKPDHEGSKVVCSPPLREKWNQEKLWEGLSEGVLSTIGSDHSPFHFEDKKRLAAIDFSQIPNGVSVIEEQYGLLFDRGVLDGKISIHTFVKMMSTNPAKLFGLYPRKGTIAVGSDADLVILDPEGTRLLTKENQESNTDYNVYEGQQIRGVLRYVLSRGDIVAQEGKYIGDENRGIYLHRNPVNDMINTI